MTDAELESKIEDVLWDHIMDTHGVNMSAILNKIMELVKKERPQ